MLRAAGWLYLAMPDQCYNYLRHRISKADSSFKKLTAVELHAIGLSFESPDDLREFYPLAVNALDRQYGPPTTGCGPFEIFTPFFATHKHCIPILSPMRRCQQLSNTCMK